MKIYALGGLGADRRTFKFLQTSHELICLDWIPTKAEYSIPLYAQQLRTLISTEEDFALLGVSFGGMVMTELAKLVEPKYLFLVSSIATQKELPSTYKLAGKLSLDRGVPYGLVLKGVTLIQFLFGVKNERDKSLVKEILADSDPSFIKWAIRSILTWENDQAYTNTIRIHGTKDRVLPCVKEKTEHPIEKQGHFVIVERAELISEILDSYSKLEMFIS